MCQCTACEGEGAVMSATPVFSETLGRYLSGVVVECAACGGRGQIVDDEPTEQEPEYAAQMSAIAAAHAAYLHAVRPVHFVMTAEIRAEEARVGRILRAARA